MGIYWVELSWVENLIALAWVLTGELSIEFTKKNTDSSCTSRAQTVGKVSKVNCIICCVNRKTYCVYHGKLREQQDRASFSATRNTWTISQFHLPLCKPGRNSISILFSKIISTSRRSSDCILIPFHVFLFVPPYSFFQRVLTYALFFCIEIHWCNQYTRPQDFGLDAIQILQYIERKARWN